MTRRLVFDTESDGLRWQATRLHIITIEDIDSGESFVFRDRRLEDKLRALPPGDVAPNAGWIEDGLRMLESASLIVGHNALNHDLPLIERLHPWFNPAGQIRDTMILVRLLFSDIKEDDFGLHRKGKLPGQLIGRHSLKAWGYRLDEHKAEFGDDDIDCWDNWTVEMDRYAVQDTVVGAKLWRHCEKYIAKTNYSQDAIRLEHRFADLIERIETNGFPFKEEEAKALYARLSEEREAIRSRLLKQFRPWWKAEKWAEGRNGKPMKWREGATVTPARTIRYKLPADAADYKAKLRYSRTEGCPFTPVTLMEFNPGSRDQIADRLQRLWGWKPREFTETGKPRVSEDILRDLVGTMDKVDDGTLDDLDADQLEKLEPEADLYDGLVGGIPQAKDLADFFLVQKRIGQLAEGKNGWLKLVRDGKVHGSVNSLGAVTRRVTHARPNMSQCPAIRSPYGVEMRALWHVPEGWLQFGTDLSGIEIRCFADALAEWDDGAYARSVIEDDIHTVNMHAFGVPTRDKSKTTLYALTYGAGDAKLGSIVDGGPDEGRRIRQNFMRQVPAYRSLTSKLNKLVDRQGWIPALDGGRLHVRSPHKALNTSLQSAGALVAKWWSVEIEDRLVDGGWKHGWDGDFAALGMYHDELQFAVRTPGVDPSSYSNPTDYASWTVESAKAKDEKDLKKKIEADRKKHKQRWFWEQSPEIRRIGATVKSVIRDAEKHFEFRCPLDCEFIVGLNWADCH